MAFGDAPRRRGRPSHVRCAGIDETMQINGSRISAKQASVVTCLVCNSVALDDTIIIMKLT